jgi:non-homologous end joining protein Ku
MIWIRSNLKRLSFDIKEFIDSKDFDPILIDKSYYVAPAASY